jgi:hypothetical protein
VDKASGPSTLHVRWVKQGTPNTHSILGDELRSLRRLQREQERQNLHSCSRRSAERLLRPPARMIERASNLAKL